MEIFGQNVFNQDVMRERLPKAVFKNLKKTIDEGLPLDPSIADVVATAMKEWAIEKGATHFTHWFQPMTGVTAESSKGLVKEPVTEVLVANVRVMATNQKSTAHGGDVPVVPATVSVEVSPEDAQKIRLAENGNGNLSVALRALKEKDNVAPSKPSALSDLSATRSLPDPGNQQIVIVRGVHADTVGVSRP